MGSLLKFASRRPDLHWGMAAEMGAPFRGDVPTLKEGEADSRLIQVNDPKIRIFDLSDPKQEKDYVEILDKVSNDWAQIIFIERHALKTVTVDPETKASIEDVRMKVYVEWLERYVEDSQKDQR